MAQSKKDAGNTIKCEINNHNNPVSSLFQQVTIEQSIGHTQKVCNSLKKLEIPLVSTNSPIIITTSHYQYPFWEDGTSSGCYQNHPRYTWTMPPNTLRPFHNTQPHRQTRRGGSEIFSSPMSSLLSGRHYKLPPRSPHSRYSSDSDLEDCWTWPKKLGRSNPPFLLSYGLCARDARKDQLSSSNHPGAHKGCTKRTATGVQQACPAIRISLADRVILLVPIT